MQWPVTVLARLALDAGWLPGEAQTAVAVALAVSGGDDAWRYLNWRGDVTRAGLWGLDPTEPVVADPGLNLYRPTDAADAAYATWRAAGRTWAPWAWVDPSRVAGFAQAAAQAVVVPATGFTPDARNYDRSFIAGLEALIVKGDRTRAAAQSAARYTPAVPEF